MARTFLQLIQDMANELGIPEPSQIIGAVDDQSKQLLSLAQREGKNFSALAHRDGGWSALHKEHTFRTAALQLTGNITAGSNIITGITDTSGVLAETWAVEFTGLNTFASVVSVDSTTQVTLSQPASDTATGVTLNFAQIAYDLPSDLEYFAVRTFWDDAYKWELIGPIDAQEKQILRYGIIASGPRRKFYIRNKKMYLDPLPADNELLAYDYYSNAWCEAEDGTVQTRWTADTDYYRLDEDCFVLGLKWRWLNSKKLDYIQEKADYDAEVQRVMARDAGGGRDLPIAGGTYGARFLDGDNIPETGFGGV